METTPVLGSRAEKKAFYRRALAITAPIALQNFMDAAVSSADVIMLSFVGQTAMAASSLAGQVAFVLQMLLFGISSGASVLSAQYWGKGDRRAVERVMGLLCAFVFKIPEMWVYFVLCLDEFVKIPVVIGHYRRGEWLRNITHNL